MYPLVEYETNKFIKNSFHQQKYQERFNLDKFISIINSSSFKEHKEYNQVSNFFQPSIEIIAKEILDDLNENGLKRRKDRLTLFLKDLNHIINIYKNILEDVNLDNIIYFNNSIKKHIHSDSSNLELAKADITNLIQEYNLIEKSIITSIVLKLSELVSKNYSFILFDFWYDDDENIKPFFQNNITQKEIEKYFALLLIILMNKNISKKEIIDLFIKLCSYTTYHSYIGGDGIFFDSKYPLVGKTATLGH